jgi:aminoglycoside phosphotransferase (APT) family kinase protein
MAALRASAVPVPCVYLWSDDPSILGDPFFIAEKVPGDAPIPWGDEDGIPDERRGLLGAQFADTLGDIHAADWTSSGLAKFAAGLTCENVAARELQRWEANYRRWALRSYPMLHRVLAWLREHPPLAPRICIVHGDYRLGNFLEVGGRITAILDWELVHLGDPHEDLAWVCLPQYRGGTPLMSKLIIREDLYARHELKTGRAVEPASIYFYTLFALVKLSITHIAGVYAFERNGFRDLRLAAIGTQIAPTLRQIEKLLESGQ